MVEWKGKREEELRWEQDGDRVRRHEKGVENGVRGEVGGVEVGIGLGWRRSDRGYGERGIEGEESGERKRSGEEGRKGGVRQRGERRGKGGGVDVGWMSPMRFELFEEGKKDPNSGFVYVRRAVFQMIFSNGEQMVYGRISPCALDLLCRHLH